MRYVITGGGTGGHIYPALAVAEALLRDPSTEQLLYIGKKNGLESTLVPAKGVAFEGIEFYGMPRKLGFGLLKWFMDLKTAIRVSKKLIQAVKPDVVFGTGGYVSAPVLLAAKQLKIPYVIHEPDSHPGLANRLLARGADQITAAFAESAHFLAKGRQKQRYQVTGNPIRTDIGQYSKAQAIEKLGLDWDSQKPILLVAGGSQGARRINEALVATLPALIEELGLQIIHQTGGKLYEETLAQLPEVMVGHPAYCVRPYYDDMAVVLAMADLALCRAGSLTLSEMYVSGIPTILVPYPYAAADHQRKNAQASVRAGASLMVLDAECTGERIFEELSKLVCHPDRQATMRQAALRLAHPQATQTIIGILKKYGVT